MVADLPVLFFGWPDTRQVMSTNPKSSSVQAASASGGAAAAKTVSLGGKHLASLTAAGVADKDIQTTNFMVQPRYDYNTNNQPPRLEYDPGHPDADAKGYVAYPNVNAVEEMVDMLSASRSYQNNVEVMNTSKELLLATLRLGQ